MAFISPEQAVKNNFNLASGMQVADFGAGASPYAAIIGEIVGTEGRVYAIDIQKDLLSRLKDDALRLGVRNIETIWGDVEKVGGTKIADESVEFIVAANILFQLESPYAMAIEAKRVLRSGGSLAVIDWKDSPSFGPQPNKVLGEEEAKKVFAGAGFAFIRSFDAGDHHFGLIFKK